MKILVTGSEGFIGRALAADLRAQGHELTCLGRQDGDMQNPGTWERLNAARFDHVFHLAASGTIPDSWERIPEYLESITVGTSRVMEFCKSCNASFTYLSSYMYGMPQYLPIDENHPVDTRNPYALAKKLSEEVCYFYTREFGLKGVVLRPFVIFGPGQKEDFLIPSLVRQALFEEKIVVNDITPKKRDYLYIDDFVALAAKTIKPEPEFTVVNAGMGESFTIGELIGIIQEVTGADKIVESRNIVRKNDYPDVVATIEKARQTFHWQPRYSMKNALARFIKLQYG